MHASGGAPLEAIAAAILAHLAAHPFAADSADGVARWWLGASFANVPSGQVQQALDLLVERGALRRLKLMDGTFLYSQARSTPH